MRLFAIVSIALLATIQALQAQALPRRQDDPIPPQVDQMYVKGLRYLAGSQTENGNWPDRNGSEPGVVGLCVMAFLAHGEDPNHGPYSLHIRRGIDFILENQNETNGYIGSSMYNHGFATLALAETYGVEGRQTRFRTQGSSGSDPECTEQQPGRMAVYSGQPGCGHNCNRCSDGCPLRRAKRRNQS